MLLIVINQDGEMDKLNEYSLKQIALYLDGKSLTFQKLEPEDSEELNELIALDKKGLTKFIVIDTSASFIASKYVLEKLIEDFSTGDSVISEIVDRSLHAQNLLQIHAPKIWLRKTVLTPEQFQKMVREEDLILEKYKNKR